MRLVQTSDYIIYFDNVRVDPYVISWNTELGLAPGQATGAVTMYRSAALMRWKAYLTQVRVFTKNIFTGKYCMVFEGEIASRNWNDQRENSGQVSFPIQGFYHWFEVPIPLNISLNDQLDPLEQFYYEAQGINYKAVRGLFKSDAEIKLKNKDIRQVLDYLFEQMNQGYYEASGGNNTFAWADLKRRLVVMADIVKEFRESGILDLFALDSSTQIQTFYVYLNQVLSQLMFEFYQDRDGILRIKNPSWKDNILKCHVLDESVIDSISGSDGWDREPTRVLVVGGIDPIFEHTPDSALPLNRVDLKPIGLWVGDAQLGHYYDGATDMEALRSKYGIDATRAFSMGLGTVDTGQWYDNLTDKYTITSKFTGTDARTDVAGNTNPHRGTDYGLPNGTAIYNVGTAGRVSARYTQANGGGNILEIKEIIGSTNYTFKYMHLSKFLVSVDDVVQPGQEIALSGGAKGAPGAGNSTGAHLHLEIWDMDAGAPLDPDAFLRKAKAEITAQVLAEKDKTTQANPNINDAKFKAMMSAISAFSGAIYDASIDEQVDLSVAKAYVAVRFDGDVRDVKIKTADYKRSTFIGSLISFLSGWSSDDMKELKTSVSDQDGQTTADLFSRTLRKVLEDERYTAENPEGKAYNAFSTSDVPRENIVEKYGIFSKDKPLVPDATPAAMKLASDWMDFTATAYVATCPGCTGKTYSGEDVTDTTKDYRIIAVDLSVIPLYSTVQIDGPKGVSGIYEALDTGGAIKGRIVDILMNSEEDALEFGRQKIRLRILRKGRPVLEGGIRPRTVAYAANTPLSYPIPEQGKQFEDFIKANPGGIDPNLICAIIDASSGWRQKYGDQYMGLMGIPRNYRDAYPTSVDWTDGNRSIELGSEFLAFCLSKLNNQVTLALAAYRSGDPTAIDTKVRVEARSYNYVDVVPFLNKDIYNFVDNVMDIYLNILHADYIQGDPHKAFSATENSVGIAPTQTPATTSNQFGIGLSEEELRFKMTPGIFTQQLIRYGTTAANGERRIVQRLMQAYAQYVMQVSRAAAHSLQVSCTVCLPFLRPGFNAWIEPSRANLVAYITAVRHQGTYGQGCFSSVQTEFVRTASTYDKVVVDNVFLGSINARASDFGEVVLPAQMSDLRDRLIAANEEDIADDAHNVSVLRELYASTRLAAGLEDWAREYTAEEIDAKLQQKYAGAPAVIKQRTVELTQVIEESEDFFVNKLFAEFGR